MTRFGFSKRSKGASASNVPPVSKDKPPVEDIGDVCKSAFEMSGIDN